MAESTSNSEILQTPQVTEKAEDEGGKGKKAIDQVGIPPPSNDVPHMFPPLLPDGSENIESELLDLDRHCNFEELVKNMKGDTPKIRKWYAGVERGSSKSRTELGQKMDVCSAEELGRMMARSGLLILEFLRFLAFSGLPWSSKEFFQPKERQLSVKEAVIKIDNQIPFFVLKKILEWEWDADKYENRLADTYIHCILKQAGLKLSPIQYNICGICHSHVKGGVPFKEDSHLLEFVYENIIRSSDFKHPCKRRKNKRRGRHISLPQAEQLQGKGVKFAPNEGLLDKICFNRSTLYLPAIEMNSGTDAVLRNLVLFEASKQEERPQPLLSYVDLMDRLIDTPEDVQALRDGGIIHNHLGSNNDVANVWNGMRRELPAEIIKYKPIDNAMDDVISFYTSKCRTICAEISGRYFSKPWSVISLFAACILLGLAAFQTYLAWEQVRLQRESMPKT